MVGNRTSIIIGCGVEKHFDCLIIIKLWQPCLFFSAKEGWDSWDSWSLKTACSSECGEGSQMHMRTRRCMSPENGEMACNGLSAEYKNDSCFITQCQGIYIHVLVLILLDHNLDKISKL